MWFFFCGKPSLDERPTLTAFPPEENRMLDVVTLSLKRFFFGTYYPPAHSLLCFPFTGRIPPCCSGEDSPPEFTLENTCTVLVSSEKVVRKMFSTNAHSWHTHTHTHFYTILVSGDPSLGIPQGFKVFLSVLPQMWFLSLNLEKLCLLKTLLSSQTATLIVCINCYGGEQFWSWSFDPKKQINKWTTKRWSPATAAQSGSVCFSYDCLNAASLMLTCLSEIGSSVRLVLRLHPPPPSHVVCSCISARG